MQNESYKGQILAKQLQLAAKTDVNNPKKDAEKPAIIAIISKVSTYW